MSATQQLLFFGGNNPFTGPYYLAVTADAPLMYLRLSDASGSTALDSSGAGHNGSYINSPTLNQTGLLDNESDASASFDGTSQYVSVPYGSWMNSGQVFSAEALIYPISLSSTVIARRFGGNGDTRVFHLRGWPSMVLCDGLAEFEYRLVTDASVVAGVRRHIAGTFSGGRLKLYVNGLLRYDRATGVTIPQPTVSHITCGAIIPQNVILEPSNGRLDEPAYYGTALTAARIKAHAQAAGITVTDYTHAGVASTAAGVYALRSINGYSGSIIDVRRSSDNTTRTIGLVSGELDTADLASWGGSDSVYVSKWYDQSGNGLHLLQATNANQPRIVNAGALETQNAKPIINVLTSTYLRESATSLIGSADSVTILKVSDTIGFGRGQDGFGAGWSIACGPSGHAVVFTSTGLSSYSVSGTDSSTFGAQAFRIANQSGGSSFALARDVNGIEQDYATSGGNSTFRTSTVGFEIGRSNGSGLSGKIGELYIWRSILDHGQQQAVTSNAGTRYGF